MPQASRQNVARFAVVAAEGTNARLPIQQIAADLQELLGQKLTAYMIGIADGRDIGRYARLDREPSADTGFRLRNLHYVVALLRQHDDPETIRAWFMGMNRALNDESPAHLLHERPDEGFSRVVDVARQFIETG